MSATRFQDIEKQLFDAAHDQHETGKTLREVLLDFLDSLARSECVYCRRGDMPRRLPRGTYSHRVPEGRNGNLIGLPCRATEIRKAMECEP